MNPEVVIPSSGSSSSFRLYDAPYVDGKDKAPRTVTTESIFSLIQQEGLVSAIGLVLVFIGGAFYLVFPLLFDLIGYFKSFIVAKRDKSYWRKSSDGPSSGIISEHVCRKTGRTFVTRFVDPSRDVVDCSQLLVNAFNADPFTCFLIPDVGPRHLYGIGWYKFFFESPLYDVVIQEWKEEEKIVGVLILSQGRHNQLQDLIDYSKWMSSVVRYLFISPRSAYMQLRMAIAMENKFHHVCNMFKFKEDPMHVKFLGVEKGWQGLGVGSNLLKVMSSHAEALGRSLYLESSNICNVPLYERYGFRMMEEWSITPGCPPLYLMLRSIPDSSLDADDDDVQSTAEGGSVTLSPSSDNTTPMSPLSAPPTPPPELRQRH